MTAIETASLAFSSASAEARAAIFTRKEVVDFILDLVGYTHDMPLSEHRILEPAFGQGDFLVPIVERLLAQAAKSEFCCDKLENCVLAVELHQDSFLITKEKLLAVFATFGFSSSDAERLLSKWLVCGDFLLADIKGTFSHVVGNPPYIRQELIPEALLREYRIRFSTIYDRADIYIPFIEKSLSLLASEGQLGFICSDRWMKNKYGGKLRQYVSKGFRLKTVVDMVETQSFHSDVIAYPAITVIAKEPPGPTYIVHRPEIVPTTFAQISGCIRTGQPNPAVVEAHNIINCDQPWVFEALDHYELVRRLEIALPNLEEAGCKVGIGVATGADEIFIKPYDELDVETECKLPLLQTKDLVQGEIQWRGYGVINPFTPDGKLVDLDQHPRLARYLLEHEDRLRKRHVAKNNTNRWYRTIDRIDPALTYQPKLVIPDIKNEPHIVFEEGHFYPHHNLYYITSTEWDLHALQAILMSGIAHLFISTFSTKMRGGYFRFQAQYLRKIRVPYWVDVPEQIRHDLVMSARHQDVSSCRTAIQRLYSLTDDEMRFLREGWNAN